MRALLNWLEDPAGAPRISKASYIEVLSDSLGVEASDNNFDDSWKHAKRLLGSRSKRTEGLGLVALLIDNTPDIILGDNIVSTMKQLINIAGTEEYQARACVCLHRLLLRVAAMRYILRDVASEVFDPLMQLITRLLEKQPACAALLGVTDAALMVFGKRCLRNRDQLERFLLPQLVVADQQSLGVGTQIGRVLVALASCHGDVKQQQEAAGRYQRMLLATCMATLTAFCSAHDQDVQLHGDGGSIYEISKISLRIDASEHEKMAQWKRLTLQMRALEEVVVSPIGGVLETRTIIQLLYSVLDGAFRGANEHYVFLRPSLVKSVLSLGGRLATDLEAADRRQLSPTLMQLGVELLNAESSCCRRDVWEFLAKLLTQGNPPTFLLKNPDQFQQIIDKASHDVMHACVDDGRTVSAADVERCAAALNFQRAVVMAHGHVEHIDSVQTIVAQLITSAVALAQSRSGAVARDVRCRRALFDLLAVFVTRSNASLLPPTTAIADLLAVGLNDRAYEVRSACVAHYANVTNALAPLECGFGASFEHQLHKRQREARRLELNRRERTGTRATQTDLNAGGGGVDKKVGSDEAMRWPSFGGGRHDEIMEEDDDDEEDEDDEEMSDDYDEDAVIAAASRHQHRAAQHGAHTRAPQHNKLPPPHRKPGPLSSKGSRVPSKENTQHLDKQVKGLSAAHNKGASASHEMMAVTLAPVVVSAGQESFVIPDDDEEEELVKPENDEEVVVREDDEELEEELEEEGEDDDEDGELEEVDEEDEVVEAMEDDDGTDTTHKQMVGAEGVTTTPSTTATSASTSTTQPQVVIEEEDDEVKIQTAASSKPPSAVATAQSSAINSQAVKSVGDGPTAAVVAAAQPDKPGCPAAAPAAKQAASVPAAAEVSVLPISIEASAEVAAVVDNATKQQQPQDASGDQTTTAVAVEAKSAVGDENDSEKGQTEARNGVAKQSDALTPPPPSAAAENDSSKVNGGSNGRPTDADAKPDQPDNNAAQPQEQDTTPVKKLEAVTLNLVECVDDDEEEAME